MQTEFIADINVGGLARWLRMMGYDTLLFREKDDSKMIEIGLKEDRVILTRNSQIMKRRIVASGQVKAIHIEHNESRAQLRDIVETLNLDYHYKPFSLCLECNRELLPRRKEELRELVPPRVFEIQEKYMECPSCHRLYWHGTHWQAMVRALENLSGESRDVVSY